MLMTQSEAIDQIRNAYVTRHDHREVERQAGAVLAQIREERSWPDRYRHFYAYVRDQWGIGRTRCNFLIQNAKKSLDEA